MNIIKKITEELLSEMKKDWENDNFYAGNTYKIKEKSISIEEIAENINKNLKQYIYNDCKNPYHVDLSMDNKDEIAVFFDKPAIVHGSNKLYSWIEKNNFNVDPFNVSSKEVVERLNKIFEWEKKPYRAKVVEKEDFCNLKANIVKV